MMGKKSPHMCYATVADTGIKLNFYRITYISLFEKIFLELLENILTNQSGAFELPPTGLKIFVHRAGNL